MRYDLTQILKEIKEDEEVASLRENLMASQDDIRTLRDKMKKAKAQKDESVKSSS